MKRIYEEYLYVPEDGKIREKVFIMRIVVAIVCIVCCLSAMGFSAYAFFASSITSGSNTIVAATYGVEAVITSSDGTPLTVKSDETLLYEAVSAGTYTVSLKASGTAKNGYCKIEIVGSEKTVTLFTRQMAPGENMSFTLVTNGAANITVTPQWGTYSNRSVVVDNGSTQEILLVTEKDTSAAQSDDSAAKEDTPAIGPDTSTKDTVATEQQTESSTGNESDTRTETRTPVEESTSETTEEAEDGLGNEIPDDGTE